MIAKRDGTVFLCKRLEHMGFASGRRIKLYGEEFEVVSGPAPHERGYGIVGMSQKSGGLRHLLIPLSLVRTIEHEFQVMEEELAA
jgi:hypothetical protein